MKYNDNYIIIKEVSQVEAINLLGGEPENFFTYYIHPLGEDKYIIREGEENILLLIEAI